MATVADSEQTALHCASFRVSRIEEGRRCVAMIDTETTINSKQTQTPRDAVRSDENGGTIKQ